MRKINYLFAIIATVFVLGMTSCDPNEVTPDNTVDGIQLEDLTGFWTNTETKLNGSIVVCNDDLDLTDATVNFNISVSSDTSGSLTAYYQCNNGTPSSLSIEDFDDETLVMTLKFGLKFQILDGHDLTSTTKTIDLELIDNGGGASTEGLIYTLVK